MKMYVSVICACAVLASIGSALGDGEGVDIGSQTAAGGASSSTGARVCPEDFDTYSHTRVTQEILNIIERCLKQSDQSFKAQIETEQMDNARSFFSDFCQKSPKVSECLAEESSKWEKCHNDIQNKLLSIVRDVVESEVAIGCVDNGESLATIVHGVQRITKDFSLENNFVRNCLISSNERAAVVLKNKAHLSSKILFVYHELKTLRDCFIKNVHDDETFISFTGEHINKTLDGMKCIHPQDETLVLCKTINSSLIDRIEICPLRRIDLSSVTISLALEGKATSCFMGLDLNINQYLSARSLEEFHSFFSIYCGRQDIVKNCLRENELAAEICLQKPQYNSYKNVSDHLKLSLESVCLEDGRRMANIFFAELQRRENSTNPQDAILQCLAEATGTNAQNDPATDMEYYPSFPMLKECLVNKAAGDSTFVNDVESYVNEMITKKKYQHHL